MGFPISHMSSSFLCVGTHRSVFVIRPTRKCLSITPAYKINFNYNNASHINASRKSAVVYLPLKLVIIYRKSWNFSYRPYFRVLCTLSYFCYAGGKAYPILIQPKIFSLALHAWKNGKKGREQILNKLFFTTTFWSTLPTHLDADVSWPVCYNVEVIISVFVARDNQFCAKTMSTNPCFR